MTSSPILDHLILFLPPNPATNLPQIPLSIQQSFSLTPGGIHADGLTSNTLILLADGCYIELISFLPPALPSTSTSETNTASGVEQHWWGPDPDARGWKDWCLTHISPPTSTAPPFPPSTHAQSIPGSRRRPDNILVRWAVAFPTGPFGGRSSRGRIPFFCHDVTERRVRVPMEEKNTVHRCGALGVGDLTVLVGNREGLEGTRREYVEIFGQDAVESIGSEGFEVRISRMREVQRPGSGATLTVRVPRDEVEREKLEGRDFWFGDVVLEVRAGNGKVAGSRERVDGEGEGNLGGFWVRYV